jgi:hypothetical protein
MSAVTVPNNALGCSANVTQTQRQNIMTTTEITSTFMVSPLTHLIVKKGEDSPQRQPQNR